jgi:cytochrome oxidase Cu insertion factor (SCO1/SenC/PrrC family)
MNRRAWPLLALAALFFGPLLLSILLYAGRDTFGGFALVPNPDRELIEAPQPNIPLHPLRLHNGTETDPAWSRSRWSLIYARISACGDECQAALTRLHQVWLTLGGDRERVQQILLVPASELPADVPAELLSGILDAAEDQELVRLLGQERLEAGRYFVVDPLGNVILTYPDDADQGRLREDLERLLDVSRVG